MKMNLPPIGYRSPAFDLGPNTLNLFKENSYLYDSSVMAPESPYYIAKGGIDSGIIESPVCWELDDAPYYLFAIKPSYRKGLSDPDSVLKVWEKEFDFAYRETGFYLLTLHPQISGRGYRPDTELVNFCSGKESLWGA